MLSTNITMEIYLISTNAHLCSQFYILAAKYGAVINPNISADVAGTANTWGILNEITNEKHSLLFGKLYVDGGPVKNIEPVGTIHEIMDLMRQWDSFVQKCHEYENM